VGNEKKTVAYVGGENFQGLTKRFKKRHSSILSFYPLRPVTIDLLAHSRALTNLFETL
jgi:hypothetical protein